MKKIGSTSPDLIGNNFIVFNRLFHLNWYLISIIITIASIGFLMLYSSAGGSIYPWMIRQLLFFIFFFFVMLFIAITDLRIWYKLSYFIYLGALGLVFVVFVKGHSAMGAERWFRIGPLTIQPSEIMKVAMVLAIARYFSTIELEKIGKIRYIIIPVLLILIPTVLVFIQPDLGTSSILLMVGAFVLFLAGVKTWKFILAGILGLISIPIAWMFVLYDYQKKRIINFINPDNDPLGSGYNIIQSKIAIGSGGFFGKGYLSGTQGQLNFLPEKQTDFIFTMLAEELGFTGCAFLIFLFLSAIMLCNSIALRTKHQYGKLLVTGLMSIFFIHMFTNIGMVIGILPVVGAPLPLISYGGTITATILIAFGFILNVDLNKNNENILR